MGIVKLKRPLAPVSFLQKTIDEIAGAQDEASLTVALEKFDSPHHFERSEERNLLNWVKVLNRFDELLDKYVSERDVLPSKAQDARKSSSDLNSSADFVDSSKHNSLQRASSSASDSRPEKTGTSSGSALPTDEQKSEKQATSGGKRDSKLGSGKPVFSPSPALVCLILRLTQRLVRNASHDTRNIYGSVDRIGALLADENTAIVLLALGILNLLLQRTQKLRSNRMHISYELTERLLDLAVGWGGRENGLGLLECCSRNNTDSLPPEGSNMYFEYSKSPDSSPTEQSPTETYLPRDRRVPIQDYSSKRSLFPNFSARSFSSIPIPLPLSPDHEQIPKTEEPIATSNGTESSIQLEYTNVFQGQERWLLTDFAVRHNVPKSKLFSLLSAFRRAKVFSQGREARLEMILIRLYAVTTLFQVQPTTPAVGELLAKEPEFLNDIVALARADKADGVDDIPRHLRVIAIKCITAMTTERQRVTAIMSAVGVSVHHGALTTLLRSEIDTLLSLSSSSDEMHDVPSAEAASADASSMDESQVEAKSPPSSELKSVLSSNRLSALFECRRVPPMLQRIQTTEALLALVHSLAVAAGSSGATPLANSGVLGILIPLLKDTDMFHARVVAQAIRAMQAIVEGSAQTLGCQLFRDQNGLTLVADRIALEVGIDDVERSTAEQLAIDEKVESDALKTRGETRSLYQMLGHRQMTPAEALEYQPPSSSMTSRGLLSHSKWALLRALHQLLLAAVGNGGNEVRELVVNSKLPKSLRQIMARPFLYGGGLFQSAATVTAEIAHAEPTATPELVKADLAATVLGSIDVGLPPCGEAVRCIPNLLAALCLAPNAREIIVSSHPLKPYLLRLATPFYSRALQGDIPVHIGSALDELMRHVEALREEGNEAMTEYLRLSAEFVNSEMNSDGSPSRVEGTKFFTPENMKGKSQTPNSTSESGNDSGPQSSNPESPGDKVSPEVVLLDKMKLAVANNSCRLAGFAQGSSEHQEGIVENGGLDHMINLRYAPALACSEASDRDSTSSSRHYPTPAMTVVSLVTSLRNFSSRHGTSVLRSLFTVILKDAANVLEISRELDGSWLHQEDETKDEQDHNLGSTLPKSNHPDSMDRNSRGGLEGAALSEEEPLSMGPSQFKAGEAKITVDFNQPSTEPDKLEVRAVLRSALSEALCKLRVDVVLLSGLSRGGPGSSAGAWENAGGSQVAAIISTVERAARYHLALVYTGLTLSASPDGDLSTARVTAADDPAMNSVNPDLADEFFGDIDKILGKSIAKSPKFAEACKHYKVPPEGHDPVRQEVKGLAWCLVTFAVAAQRLYSTLSRSLTFSSRRLSRDPARYAASAKSLAATIGRTFALHLKAAESLWHKKVITMGNNQVTAAWDYVRGILIEIKGTLFDESRRVTQSLILRSFLDAGGGEALMSACRPFLIVQAASPRPETPEGIGQSRIMRVSEEELDNVLEKKSLSVGCILLALDEVLSQQGPQLSETKSSSMQSADNRLGTEKDDTDMSTDSISNQARGISRIVVTEAESRNDNAVQNTSDLQEILSNQKKLKLLRHQTTTVATAALTHCESVAVRRIASDVWNTLCGFLHLLASCPGLLNSSSSPMPEPSGSANEWEPKDIQRTSLTFALRMLSDVTKNPHELLSAFRPDGSAMTDLLGIMHTTSQVADDVCQRNDASEGEAGALERSVTFRRQSSGAEAASPPSPDPDILRSLIEMGFPERRAASAVRQTAPGGLEEAMEWLLSHQRSENDTADSDDEERRTWDEGDADGEPDSDAEGGADSTGDSRADGDNTPEPNVPLGSNAEDSPDLDASIDPEGDSIPEDAAGLITEVICEDPADNNLVSGSTARNTDSGEDDMAGEAAPTPDGQEIEAAPRPSGDGMAGTSPRERRRRNSRLWRDSGDSQQARRAAKPDRRPKKSGDEKSSPPPVNIESEGQRLVKDSLKTELSLLSSALEKAHFSPIPDAVALQSMTGVLIDEELPTDVEPLEKDDGEVQPVITAVSVESFEKSKKDLFGSIIPVTREAIQGSSGHPHGKYLPYIAIELLSILQKDGTLSDNDSTEFASLLDHGLQLVLSEEKSNEGSGSGSKSDTTSLWAHYGGNRARRALKNCGTFNLAFESLSKSIAVWEISRKSPIVDEEATRPIGKLTIREDLDFSARTKKNSLAVDHAGKSEQRQTKHLRPIGIQEAVLLKRMTTCLLLLDALVRYEAKDLLIECSKKVPNAPEPAKEAKKDSDFKGMDTDDNDMDDGNSAQRADGSQAEGTSADQRAETINELSEVMRDLVEMASSSAMDIEGSEAKDNDIESLKKKVEKRKRDAVQTVKKTIAKWISAPNSTEQTNISFSQRSLLSHCLKLLSLWQFFEVGDSLLALLQLVASLTRQWDLAKAAIEEGIVPLLLRLPHLEAKHVRSTDYRVARLLTKTIIRHVVEDPETLREAMTAEIRSLLSGGQSRSRPAYTLRSLIMATSPMVARDIQCFISVLASTVKVSEGQRGSQIALREYDVITATEVEPLLATRENVCSVISCLSEIVAEEQVEEYRAGRSETPSSSTGSEKKTPRAGLAKYALEILAELVEFSQVAAVAFIRTQSPCADVSGTAFDFIIQKVLPQEFSNDSGSNLLALTPLNSDADELSGAARTLFLALCSKTANTHNEAVNCLAKAVKLEADKDEVSAALIKGVAQCIVPNTKLRVLRVFLDSGIANDLARSLNKLDMSVEKNFEVATAVLRALSLAGQTATYIARHGDSAGEDVSFSGSGRDPWSSVRDREEFMPGNTFMVI